MAVTPELLATFPLLKPLPADQLSQLATQSAMKKFSRREIVLKAGEHEDSLCFLFEGRLQGVDFTIDGREVGLFFVEPGGFCGELGLFDLGPQAEYIIALTPATIINIPLLSIRKLMLESPGLVNMLGTRLAARVRDMTYQRTLLGLPNVSQRVCCQLWSLVPAQAPAHAPEKAPAKEAVGEKIGEEKDETKDENEGSMDTSIKNPPTHQEIAIMLNVSRETVTRVFQKLQNRQIVKRDGSACLRLLDVAALKKLADGSDEL